MFSFFRPSNSLVLLFDHIENKNEIESQIESVGKYYKWTPLPALIENLTKRRLGFASVAFKHPWKSVLLHGVQLLHEREIPFTIFAQPDCVGTSEQPLGEVLLPVEKRDPLRTYTTWGKLLTLPQHLRDFGIWIPENLQSFSEQRVFLEIQTKATVRVGFRPKGSQEKVSGLEGVLTEEVGIIDKQTSPWMLPRYEMEQMSEAQTRQEES